MLASAETNRHSKKRLSQKCRAENGEPKRFSTFRYTPYR